MKVREEDHSDLLERNGVDESKVYCPTCKRLVELADPELFVEFGPVGARLHLDGSFDWGYLADAFIDYTHLVCNTKVRISSHACWDEEAGSYVADSDPFMEIYLGEEYVTLEDSDEEIFSGRISDNPKVWGPTLACLLTALENALSKLHKQEVDR